MLINVDAKSLEWVTAGFVSQDPVIMQELADGVDVHTVNQIDLELPDRLTAKKFLFRAIYRGTGYAFANDPDFTHVSKSTKYWDKRLINFFTKYKGLDQCHQEWIRTVGMNGRLVMPWGREYVFNRRADKQGNMQWNINQIVNYPVQGLGAELMAIARVSLSKRLKALKLPSLMICTVHDSILIDSPKEQVPEICSIINTVFKDIPRNFEKLFGVSFNMRLGCEIEVGPTWGNMQVVDNKGE